MKCYCVVLVTLAFHLVGIVARGVGNLPTNFGVSRTWTFRSRLIGQHLSDASRNLAIYCVSTNPPGDLDL